MKQSTEFIQSLFPVRNNVEFDVCPQFWLGIVDETRVTHTADTELGPMEFAFIVLFKNRTFLGHSAFEQVEGQHRLCAGRFRVWPSKLKHSTPYTDVAHANDGLFQF